MPALNPHTATTDVERALQSTIALKLRRRYPAVATIAALRAWATVGGEEDTGLSSNFDDAFVELVPVTASGAVYSWSAVSTATDDGAAVVCPTDRVAGSLPGRWLVTTSTSTAGYADAVRIYEGESAEEPFLIRMAARIPSIGIMWKGERNPDKESQIPGAFYRVVMDFEIWASSRNLRRGNEASLGSLVTGEAAEDPGVMRIIGDLRACLGGSDLGLTDGIDYVYLGAHSKVVEDLGEGLFIHSLAIRIPATLRFEDEDGDYEIPDPSGLRLQGQRVAEDGETLVDINPGDPDLIPAP